MRPFRQAPGRRYELCTVLLCAALALLACKRKSTESTAATSAAASSEPPQVAARSAVPIVDVHTHVSPDGVPRLTRLMEQHGIVHAVNLSGGQPATGLTQQLAAARASGGRISVFCSMPYGLARQPGYGQFMADDLSESHHMGAKGYKIAKALGLGMVDASGRLVPVDDPELDVVFETAGELGMPVAIHTGDPLKFWEPVSPANERRAELQAHPGWSLYGRPVPTFEQLYAALERRFARHPKTTFISVHFGNLAERPQRVAETLRKYPNVYIDTAARIPEMGRHDPAAMRRFFEEFQDRILFGSDLGVGPEPTPLFLGSSGSTPPTDAEQRLFFSATLRYFQTNDVGFAHPTPIQGDWTISGINLPPAILKKVFFLNAQRLLGLQL